MGFRKKKSESEAELQDLKELACLVTEAFDKLTEATKQLREANKEMTRTLEKFKEAQRRPGNRRGW